MQKEVGCAFLIAFSRGDEVFWHSMCFFSPACLTALGKNEAVMVVLFAGLIKQGLLSRAVKIFEDLKKYINHGLAREDLFRRTGTWCICLHQQALQDARLRYFD